MRIVVRRSAVRVTKVECEESLADTIDVGDVYAMLYKVGETDLADRLTQNLGPQEARDLAILLRRLIRRGGRRSAFHDYRAAVTSQDAARLGLVAMWYERIGRAGCRAWADLREGTAPATPALTLVETAASTNERAGSASTGTRGPGERQGLMPEWLDAPESSIWSA